MQCHQPRYLSAPGLLLHACLSPISLNLNSGAGGGDDRALPEAEREEEPDEDWCAQRGLLDPDTCSEVAKHCNETKMAAKTVQVGAAGQNCSGNLV